MKRHWPTVPEIMARAASVRIADTRSVSIVGSRIATYRDSETGAPIKIHQATVPNLVNTLVAAGWPYKEDACVTLYERPA